MRPDDLRFVTALHLQCLPHGLFPALGASFLRAYLATFLASPFGLALVALRDGVPAGYVIGATDERKHYQFVLRRSGFRLALRGGWSLLGRPVVALRFCRTRTRAYVRGAIRLARGPSGEAPASPPGGAVLCHLAVAPAARRQGVAALLGAAFARHASTGGSSSARVVTLAGAEGAGALYQRLGWVPTGTFLDRDGASWVRYRSELP